jgi:hypothetical protein
LIIYAALLVAHNIGFKIFELECLINLRFIDVQTKESVGMLMNRSFEKRVVFSCGGTYQIIFASLVKNIAARMD